MATRKIQLAFAPPDEPWFTAQVHVAQDYYIRAVLNPLTAKSWVNPRVITELADLGDQIGRQIVSRRSVGVFVLQGLAIDASPIKDLEVRRAPLFRRIRDRTAADAILGFSFFQEYREVCLDTQALTLTLSD